MIDFVTFITQILMIFNGSTDFIPNYKIILQPEFLPKSVPLSTIQLTKLDNDILIIEETWLSTIGLMWKEDY